MTNLPKGIVEYCLALSNEFYILKSKVIAKNITIPAFHQSDRRFASYSSWNRLVKAAAWILRLKSKLLKCMQVKNSSPDVDELQVAERVTVASIQWNAYPQEMAFLSHSAGDINFSCALKIFFVCLRHFVFFSAASSLRSTASTVS